MINKISEDIRSVLNNFPESDNIIFRNKLYEIDKDRFKKLKLNEAENKTKKVAYIDGGQAEIISTGNFCLSFIRIFAQVFEDNKKINSYKSEFYLFTRAKWINRELMYISNIYSLDDEISIEEDDLIISSRDASIRSGLERAPIAKVSNMARRFAELSLAKKVDADIIVLDGTLDPTFKNEEKYLTWLPKNVCALAKTSSLFTTSGNSPVILLNKLGPNTSWIYNLENNTYFVKLNKSAKHVFRFSGNKEYLNHILLQCNDSLFLGYPYGLIYVDKMARVSNEEKRSLMMNFLLRGENKEILVYLNSNNAHSILDTLG